MAPNEIELPTCTASDAYSCPPGLLGELANHYYMTAYKSVPEMALATAIATLAGIVGRAYRVGGMGLNMYVMLLAPTATGKSIARKGPVTLAGFVDAYAKERAMERGVAMWGDMSQFRGPNARSSAALYQSFGKQPSYACFFDEFGGALAEMLSPRANPEVKAQYNLFLNLFTESGSGSLDELRYSDKEKNTDRVKAPAFSWIGVTVPSTFYSLITPESIASGFIPRILTVEYEAGSIVPDNPNAGCPPSPDLVDKLAQLCDRAYWVNRDTIGPYRPHEIGMTPEASDFLDWMAESLRREMNERRSETFSGIYSRVMEKTTRLAALAIVGINPFAPCISRYAAEWAYKVCRYDADRLYRKMASGEVGEDDSDDRRKKLAAKCIRQWFGMSEEKKAKLKPRERELQDALIIPKRKLTTGLRGYSAFTSHRAGESKALDDTLKALVSDGYLKLILKFIYKDSLPAEGSNYQLIDAALLKLDRTDE
jgi:hypothetical protein